MSVPLLLDQTQGQVVPGGLKAYKRAHEFITGKGKYNLIIHKLKALAQPVDAYVDWQLDDQVQIRKNNLQAQAAVPEIGMNTLDMYVIQEGNVLPRFIRGENLVYADCLRPSSPLGKSRRNWMSG